MPVQTSGHNVSVPEPPQAPTHHPASDAHSSSSSTAAAAAIAGPRLVADVRDTQNFCRAFLRSPVFRIIPDFAQHRAIFFYKSSLIWLWQNLVVRLFPDLADIAAESCASFDRTVNYSQSWHTELT